MVALTAALMAEMLVAATVEWMDAPTAVMKATTLAGQMAVETDVH
jgi:hypothetical protein